MVTGLAGVSFMVRRPWSTSQWLMQKAPFIRLAPWSEMARTRVSSPALARSSPSLASTCL